MSKSTLATIILVLTAGMLLGWPAAAAGAAPVPQSTPVGAFPEWVNFYGINTTLNGAPVPAGAEIVAYAGGNRCGSFFVHTPGQYGVMPCYRTLPEEPGAQPGDRITFTINGVPATARGPDDPVWTANGDRKNVELDAYGTPATPAPTATGVPIYPTATPPGYPYPSATPVVPSGQYCRDPIFDGGFETGGYWSIDPVARPATRVTAPVHGGAFAVRLGIVDAPNAVSASAIRQRIDLPADATAVTLSMFVYSATEPAPGNDYFEVLVLDPATNQVLAALYRNLVGNERSWLFLSLDLLAYRGRTIEIYINVFNDGIGGRSVVFVDDITVRLCSPSPVPPTSTPTPYAPPPTPIYLPTPYPTPSGFCTEIIANGGFEAGTQGWYLGPTKAPPALVNDPRLSGALAMRLGFLDGANVTSFSSIRQQVAVPADADSVILTFWSYLASTDVAGQDHQEMVVLSPFDNHTLKLPWRVWHDNSRIWLQQRIDLTEFRGQSIVVYFNAYNDGLGGETAMFLDDISLLICRAVASSGPTAIPLAGRTSDTSLGLPTPLASGEQLAATPAAYVTAAANTEAGLPASNRGIGVDGSAPASGLVRSPAGSSAGSGRPGGPNPPAIAIVALLIAVVITGVVIWVIRGPYAAPAAGGFGSPPGGSPAAGTMPLGRVGSVMPPLESRHAGGFGRPERPPAHAEATRPVRAMPAGTYRAGRIEPGDDDVDQPVETVDDDVPPWDDVEEPSA